MPSYPLPPLPAAKQQGVGSSTGASIFLSPKSEGEKGTAAKNSVENKKIVKWVAAGIAANVVGLFVMIYFSWKILIGFILGIFLSVAVIVAALFVFMSDFSAKILEKGDQNTPPLISLDFSKHNPWAPKQPNLAAKNSTSSASLLNQYSLNSWQWFNILFNR